MWLSFLVLYLLLPWIWMRGIPQAAVDRRLGVVQAEIAASRGDIVTVEVGRSALRELRRTHFTPVGIPRPAFYPLFVTIVLPVALALFTVLGEG
jgi:hypothetical protein